MALVYKNSSCSLLVGVALLCICGIPKGAEAWGGLFNRFSPEMLANMGYGANGAGYAQPFLQRVGSGEENTFAEEAGEEEPCYGKRCTANEHCCPGSVCVDVDGVVGSCLFAYGRRAGELCRRDSDCESGLLCGGAPGAGGSGGAASAGGARVCQPPALGDKQYGETCHSSGQCDIGRGLCCTLQRRHRQAPRKVCSYFKDPLVCIGPVASDQIKSAVEHTAGEKRITGYSHTLN